MSGQHQLSVSISGLIVAALALGACGKADEEKAVDGLYLANCAKPMDGWGTEVDGVGHLMIVVSGALSPDGHVRFNRKSVTDRELAETLAEVSRLNPLPQLVLEVDPLTPCSRVKEVRSLMERSPICEQGLCSEGRDPEDWEIKGGP